MPPARHRADQIAALYATEHDYLTRVVARRANVDAQTLEDACSHAWLQLLRHTAVDLDNEPRHRIRGWLATTATREAWRLNERQRKTNGVTEHDLSAAAVDAGTIVPSPETIALLRHRLDLVRQIPERPRRFLLRLIIGNSYNEIATQENTSYRVVNRQIARAKRLLRQIDDRANP